MSHCVLESVKTDTVPCVQAASPFFTTPWQSQECITTIPPSIAVMRSSNCSSGYLLESNTENIRMSAVSVWFETVMVFFLCAM